jgi:hypothetical protein
VLAPNFSSAEQPFNNSDDNDSGDMETSAASIEWECCKNVELYLLLRRLENRLRARASWLAGGEDTGFGRRPQNPNPQFVIDLLLLFDQWLNKVQEDAQEALDSTYLTKQPTKAHATLTYLPEGKLVSALLIQQIQLYEVFCACAGPDEGSLRIRSLSPNQFNQ